MTAHGSSATRRHACIFTLTLTMVLVWLGAATNGATDPSADMAHFPFHVQLHDSVSLRQLLNGSLLPSTSAVLLRVTMACRDPQSDAQDHDDAADVEAAKDLRRWMDDAYACSGSWCWYALVDFCVVAPPSAGPTFGQLEQDEADRSTTVLAAMNVSLAQLQDGRAAWFVLSPHSPWAQQPEPPKLFDRRRTKKKHKRHNKQQQQRGLSTSLRAANREIEAQKMPSEDADDAVPWRTWNETVRLPHTLRDVLHVAATQLEGGSDRRGRPTKVPAFDGMMSWKVVRGCQTASTIAEDGVVASTPSHAGVGRGAVGRGAPMQPLLAHSLRKIERLGGGGGFGRHTRVAATGRRGQALPLTDDPQGMLLVEARHIAALLYCNNTNPDALLSNAALWRRLSVECWGGLHRRLRRHAVLHVLEHELTRRIPNDMVVLSPRLSTTAHLTGGNGPDDAARSTTAAPAPHGNPHPALWHATAEHAPLMSRVDSLEMLRASIAKTGVRLSTTQPILQAHADGLPPMRPQRIVVALLNLSSSVDGLHRLDRHLYKLQALLAAPQYFGQVRVFYALHSDAHASSIATRNLLQYLLSGSSGEHRSSSSDATTPPLHQLRLAVLPSMGHTLPLSKRYILDDHMMQVPPRILDVSQLTDVSAAVLEHIVPPASTEGGASPSNHRLASAADGSGMSVRDVDGSAVDGHRERQAATLQRFRSQPLRRLNHVDAWMSHIVGHHRGIAAIALLPALQAPSYTNDDAISGDKAVGGGFEWTQGVMDEVARYFLPIRSTSLFVNVFSMHVPVLDRGGRVVARPVSDTESASSFEDHAAQILMRTCNVRRLPALMILYGDDDEASAVDSAVSRRNLTGTVPHRRHLIAYGEFLPPLRRTKTKKATQPQPAQGTKRRVTDDAERTAVKAFWSTRRLIAAIRNASQASQHRAMPAVTAEGHAARGAKYVGHVANARLRTMGIEASGSAGGGSGNHPGGTFLNPEGWGAPYDPELASDDELPVSMEEYRPWRVPVRRKVQRHGAGGQHTPAASGAADAGSVEVVATRESAVDVADTELESNRQAASIGSGLSIREKLVLLREPHPQSASVRAQLEALAFEGSNAVLVGWDALRSLHRRYGQHPSDQAEVGIPFGPHETMDMRD